MNNKQENPSMVNRAAVKSTYDERDVPHSDVAFGAVPFDWDIGCDSVSGVSKFLGLPVTVPVKDQNGSGSCGGQSEAYGGAILSAFHDKVFTEKSAKFTYAPLAVAPNGGSSGRDLCNRAIKYGWGDEKLTPSYENGQPPSEAFMARVADITQEAIDAALKDRALAYTIVMPDIDAVAQAIRDYKFVRLGITGSNNGTWLTADPKPPVDGEVNWFHWVAGLKAQMRNGKKAIGFINSWGDATGDKGWQWLNEDWFKAQLSNNPYGAIPVWEIRCYTWNPVPLPPAFHHTFAKDLEFGSTDSENIQLQTALRIDGEFPSGVPYNERFGSVTLTAVQKFQLRYHISAPGSAGYGRCGPNTRVKLNQLFV